MERNRGIAGLVAGIVAVAAIVLVVDHFVSSRHERIALYGDSLSPAGGEADSYIKMLRHDVSALKAGMLAN